MISSPLKENNSVIQIPHILRTLQPPFIPAGSDLRSWDFKHQQIPALWTPCLLLFLNAVNYTKLSQAWEEWFSKLGLVGGGGGSSSAVVSRLQLIHQLDVIGSKLVRMVKLSVAWSTSLKRYSDILGNSSRHDQRSYLWFSAVFLLKWHVTPVSYFGFCSHKVISRGHLLFQIPSFLCPYALITIFMIFG